MVCGYFVPASMYDVSSPFYMHPLSPALESEHVTAVGCGQTHTVVAAGGECHIHAEVEVEVQPLHDF